jgi:hypothetical protein
MRVRRNRRIVSPLAFILEGSGVDLIARKFQPAGLVAYDNQKGAISCGILALVQIGYSQLVLVEAGGCSLNYQEVATKAWQIDVHRECAAETRQAICDQRPEGAASRPTKVNQCTGEYL